MLGGQVTISGLYEQVGRDELNVVVRTRHGASHLDIIPSRLSPPARVAVQIVTVADPPPDAADNEHVLPQPFAVRDTSRSPFKPPVRFSTFASCAQDSKFKGSILLFRNDEDANPVAFTVSVPASLAQTLSTSRLTRGCGQIADYEAMKKSQAAKAESGEEGAAAASAEAEEEEEEEDESSEEDSEEEDLSEDQKAMLEAVISNFTEMKGRPPTEIELVAIMNSLNARIMEQDEDDDSDVDEDELRAEVDGKDDEEDDDIDAVEEEEGASKAAAAAPAGPKTRRASTLPTPSPRCATPFHPRADGSGGSGAVSWLSMRAAVGYSAFAVNQSLDPLSLGRISPIFSPFFLVFSPFPPSCRQDSRNRHQDSEKTVRNGRETVEKRGSKTV